VADETVAEVEDDTGKYGVSNNLMIRRSSGEFVLRYDVLYGDFFDLQMLLD
jgi:hypothetical protein